jgi:putative FmdB family regulatory protein
MPIYEYRPVNTSVCTYCANGFDQIQKLSEPSLLVCPKCNQPVRRQISAPNLGKSNSSILDRSNLEKHGFTRYEKAEKGVYEKTAGTGPNVIKDKQT